MIYDECTAIQSDYWIAGEGMMASEVAYWLAFCNPTDTASEAYDQCVNSGRWHVIEISCFEHPNIEAQLRGEPMIYPAAVNLTWLEERLKVWFERIPAEDALAARDVQWPPGSGEWYRPGPLGEARVLGRWPSTGSTSVWSDVAWQSIQTAQEIPRTIIEIGCDRARFGDDMTSVFARRGPCVLHHETHNGWDTGQVCGRLIQLCKQLSIEDEDPRNVTVKVDDLHGGVVDRAKELGWTFEDVNSAGTPIDKEGYPNIRSELWFSTVERAMQGQIDISRLSDESKKLLRQQAMAPLWKADSQGRRVVEAKDITKKRIGRSPDDMDAFNLCFYNGGLPPMTGAIG